MSMIYDILGVSSFKQRKKLITCSICLKFFRLQRIQLSSRVIRNLCFQSLSKIVRVIYHTDKLSSKICPKNAILCLIIDKSVCFKSSINDIMKIYVFHPCVKFFLLTFESLTIQAKFLSKHI